MLRSDNLRPIGSNNPYNNGTSRSSKVTLDPAAQVHDGRAIPQRVVTEVSFQLGQVQATPNTTTKGGEALSLGDSRSISSQTGLLPQDSTTKQHVLSGS